MKDTICIEQDGQWYIGYFSNIPGCYVQGRTKEETRTNLSEALTIFVRNYKDRHEFVYMDSDGPMLNYRIKYRRLSSKNLAKVLKNFNFHLDSSNERFVILRRTEFPFQRLLIPNLGDLSYKLVCKIFGDSNVIVLPPKKMEDDEESSGPKKSEDSTVKNPINDRV